MDKFHVALEKAKLSEDKVAEYLKEEGCTNIVRNKDKDSKYDWIYTNPKGIVETAEVKHDKEYPKTGNVAIEFTSREKPSCISKSVADIWFYYLDGNIYRAERPSIIAYLLKHWDRYRRVKGGDKDKGIGTSDICLLKFEDFLDIFSPV